MEFTMSDKELKSTVCPYCGVGCGFYVRVQDDRAVGLEYMTDHPVCNGRLCAKGNAAIEILNHPDRLKRPMKKVDGRWEQISWSTALIIVANKLQSIGNAQSPDATAFLASAKCTNEENYMFQKLARLMGTNNVDHCARLCHSPTVVGLARAFGSGAMTNPLSDLAIAECVFIIGSNLAENHTPALHWIWAAKDQGADIIVADPRLTPIQSAAASRLSRPVDLPHIRHPAINRRANHLAMLQFLPVKQLAMAKSCAWPCYTAPSHSQVLLTVVWNLRS